MKLIDEDELLLIPGPTTLSSRVRLAMARPQQSHVSPEFAEAFKETLSLTRYVFGNREGSQFVITGSGTIGMESTAVSLFERGDSVLVLETGYFGKRFEKICEIHGCNVTTMESKLGSHINYDEVESKLIAGNFKAVLFTHVDTSTSVMNEPGTLCRIARDQGVLSVCDSVCGIGGAPLSFDALGADVVLTGSQKALAAPPGATLVAISNNAFEMMQKRKSSIASYYMDLVRWKQVMDDPRTYFCTPAVQVMLGLREALLEIKEEGLENRWTRHNILASAIRAGLEALGLQPVPDVESRAPTITTFYVPDKRAGEIQETLRLKYGIHVSRGFGDWKDTMIRVGHFGNISTSEVISFLGALELALGRGPETSTRSAVDSAMPMLSKLK